MLSATKTPNSQSADTVEIIANVVSLGILAK
jgi:hypothetical protein